MEEFFIRIAESNDNIDLAEVCSQTFYDTFVGTCTEEDMSEYLKKTYSLSKITEEITSPHSVFYVLVHQQKIIGYAKLGEQIIDELKSYRAIEIERLYVLKDCIGKGLGNMLMQKCIETAQQKNAELIYLGVWEHNYRAQAFYKKYGFTFFGSHPFPIGNTPQTDLWMKKIL